MWIELIQIGTPKSKIKEENYDDEIDLVEMFKQNQFGLVSLQKIKICIFEQYQK